MENKIQELTEKMPIKKLNQLLPPLVNLPTN